MGALDWLPDVLRSAGVPFVEHDGWRGRSYGSGKFEPSGLLVHHTGPGSDAALVRYCAITAVSPPAPLCHVVLTTDGVWQLIADGLANHAGVGVLPWSSADGAWISGNPHLIGIELVNVGGAPYTPPQADSLLLGVRAILGHKGWGLDRVTTHADFRRPVGRKNDPAGSIWFSPDNGTWHPDELRHALASVSVPAAPAKGKPRMMTLYWNPDTPGQVIAWDGGASISRPMAGEDVTRYAQMHGCNPTPITPTKWEWDSIRQLCGKVWFS